MRLDSNLTKVEYISNRLAGLRRAGLSRHMQVVRTVASYAIIDGKKKINLCSNDYLGLSINRKVIQSAKSIRQVSPSSSRLLSGNHEHFHTLETALANHRGTEAALVYPTGYSASVGVLTALADKNTVIFSDQLNHASIIDGCVLSRSEVKIFPHNDCAVLEKLMRRDRRRKIVVTEGVFSMDGDTANLRAISDLAKLHDAITVVDDAHGDFLRGPNFSGTVAESGVSVDVHVSSLSKALGCFGGYVATSQKIRELLINTSRQFIYTSALPESMCLAALTAMKLARQGQRQQKLMRNSKFFFGLLEKTGLTLAPLRSQIIPVLVGDEKKTVEFSRRLFENGTFAQAVRYPSVPRGKARIRISTSASHTKEHLKLAANAFKEANKLLDGRSQTR